MDSIKNPNESEESLEYLIQNKAPFYKIQQAVQQSGVHYLDQDQQNRPALHLATRLGQDEVVNILLDFGADINEYDNDYTALQVSIKHKQGSCFTTLVKRKADVNLTLPNTELPIFLVLKSIVDHQEGYQIGQRDAVSPFTSWIVQADGMIRQLLQAGADVNATSRQYDTVLLYAINIITSLQPKQIFNTIMQFKPNINLCNKNGQSPLHVALQYGRHDNGGDNLSRIMAFIEGGADVKAQDIDDNTMLHYLIKADLKNVAIKLLFLDQIKYLVNLFCAGGININAQNKQQITPLHLAMIGLLNLNSSSPYKNLAGIVYQHSVADILINSGAWLNVYSSSITPMCVLHDNFFGNDSTLVDTTPGHSLVTKIQRGFSNFLTILNEYRWLLSRNIDVDMPSRQKQGLLHRVVQVYCASPNGVYWDLLHD